MSEFQIIPLLTAFGLGSIMSALIQSYLSKRGKIEDRNFEERKLAYIGLLEAYHKAAVSPSEENAKNFAYWQMRCDIVGPKAVRDSIALIVSSNDDRIMRNMAHKNLKDAIRQDLSIGK